MNDEFPQLSSSQFLIGLIDELFADFNMGLAKTARKLSRLMKSLPLQPAKNKTK